MDPDQKIYEVLLQIERRLADIGGSLRVLAVTANRAYPQPAKSGVRPRPPAPPPAES